MLIRHLYVRTMYIKQIHIFILTETTTLYNMNIYLIDKIVISVTYRASRSDSSKARMSLSRTGPFTLRMIEREVSSKNSTRT